MLRVIDTMQQSIKMVVDTSIKGIVFHLAITAYSITFAFERPPAAKIAIIVVNVLVNFFSGAGILLVARALNRKRASLLALYNEIGIDIGATPGRVSSLTRTIHFYALFCALLSVFWIISFWLPGKSPEKPSTQTTEKTSAP